MLKTAAGIDIRHVPYRGSIPAMLDVIAGHIPFMVVDLQPALQQIKEGKVRALGVTTPRRVAIAPDIPTIAEGGLNGYELVAWQGVVAPAGTPRAVVERLNAAIGKVLALPEVQKSIVESGGVASPSTPEEFAQRIRSDVEKFGQIVKTAGIKVE
jgi:tripartite-type tricarboxylate transporter receptor subunit TctC